MANRFFFAVLALILLGLGQCLRMEPPVNFLRVGDEPESTTQSEKKQDTQQPLVLRMAY